LEERRLILRLFRKTFPNWFWSLIWKVWNWNLKLALPFYRQNYSTSIKVRVGGKGLVIWGLIWTKRRRLKLGRIFTRILKGGIRLLLPGKRNSLEAFQRKEEGHFIWLVSRTKAPKGGYQKGGGFLKRAIFFQGR